MSTFEKSDSSGQGNIIGGNGWSTHIHKSNDLLDPWYSIKFDNPLLRDIKPIKGYGDFNDAVDNLLPESWRIK